MEDTLKALESLEEKTKRYCPLRAGIKRGRHITSAIKDLVILFCFLVANFVVFLNIATRIAIHISLVFTETAVWLKRSVLKPGLDENIHFEPRFKSGYSPTISPIIE